MRICCSLPLTLNDRHRAEEALDVASGLSPQLSTGFLWLGIVKSIVDDCLVECLQVYTEPNMHKAQSIMHMQNAPW
jgi:hypothetical protein